MECIVAGIAKNHQRDSFDCGVADLNEYLRKYARQNHKRGIAKTYVATLKDQVKVIGYYCICTSSIAFENYPEEDRNGLGRYPIPALLIGQFAVDKSCQKMGVGKKLLFNALGRAVSVSEEIGVLAVRVDAINEVARDFYLNYGFKQYGDADENGLIPLLLPMHLLRRTQPANLVL